MCRRQTRLIGRLEVVGETAFRCRQGVHVLRRTAGALCVDGEEEVLRIEGLLFLSRQQKRQAMAHEMMGLYFEYVEADCFIKGREFN